MNNRQSKLLLISGITLVLLAVLAVVPVFYFNFRNSVGAENSTSTATQAVITPTKNVIQGKPVYLSIPSVKLNLAVIDGHYNQKTGAWTLSNNKAHFALPSVLANNEQGNTVIYGHYRPEVFVPLKKIKPGEIASVTADNGYVFNYSFVSTKAVNPKDTSIFSYQGAPILTLQTCSGAWMQNRQLYTFKLVDYQKLPATQ